MPLEKDNDKIENLNFRIRDLEEKLIDGQNKLRAVMNYLKIYLDTKTRVTEYSVKSCSTDSQKSTGVIGRLG